LRDGLLQRDAAARSLRRADGRGGPGQAQLRQGAVSPLGLPVAHDGSERARRPGRRRPDELTRPRRMANEKTGDPAVDTFLKGYSPQVRVIAVKTREVILSVLPGATEKVFPGWKVIQYGAGAGREGVFAVMSPQKERVNLGLTNGADLADPQGLLEGTGSGIRHVKLTSAEAAGAPAVRQLVSDALQALRNGG